MRAINTGVRGGWSRDRTLSAAVGLILGQPSAYSTGFVVKTFSVQYWVVLQIVLGVDLQRTVVSGVRTVPVQLYCISAQTRF